MVSLIFRASCGGQRRLEGDHILLPKPECTIGRTRDGSFEGLGHVFGKVKQLAVEYLESRSLYICFSNLFTLRNSECCLLLLLYVLRRP
jgi:hypothetical protein